MDALDRKKEEMIRHHLERRGIRDARVIEAMREVPREEFVSGNLVEFAYEDTPLPIDEEQTISQPYIVALMAEMLELKPDDRVLDIGTGSGYAAAVMSHIAGKVYSVERHRVLAEAARERFEQLGIDNIEVLHADGSKGWPEHAPYDAICVAAGSAEVPQALKDQLAEGGRMIIPVGDYARDQRLVRLTREDGRIETTNLGYVRFVPLVSEPDERPDPGPSGQGGSNPGHGLRSRGPLVQEPETGERDAVALIRECAQTFEDIDRVDLGPLLERIGDARVVLLGESSHGTSEFYRMRARITQELIEKRDFNIVAVEADWPDAAQVNRVIRGEEEPPTERAFDRFPRWMWRNEETQALVQWLKEYNHGRNEGREPVGFYGLDLYSLFSSLSAVIDYLHEVDPELADMAIRRYGCLSPYERNPAAYGAAAVSGRYRDCEDDVVHVLTQLLERKLDLTGHDGHRFRDAVHNARLVANAEKYYRTLYMGERSSWNQRDSHMFETLESLLEHEPGGKAVVWAHNSHLGNAAATEMGVRGEHNLGQLAKRHYGDECYSIGLFTDHGTVAAADHWDGAMRIRDVRPSMAGSIERLMHDSGVPRFMLPLHRSDSQALKEALAELRLERAIGVIYRPQTELQSHYFQASLSNQFDEAIWFDRSSAVTPLDTVAGGGGAAADTFPFGL